MKVLGTFIKTDLRTNKGAFVRSCIFITLILIFSAVFMCYSSVIVQGMEKADSMNVTSNSVTAVVDHQGFENESLRDELSSIPRVKEVHKYASQLWLGSGFKVLIGDKNINMNTAFSVNYMDSFPLAYGEELKSKGHGNVVSTGALAAEKSQVTCSGEFLNILGVDASGIMGKRLRISTVVFDPETKQMTEKTVIDKTVVGITNEKLCDLDVYNGEFLPTLFLSTSNLDADPDPNTMLFYDIYLDSYFNRAETSRLIAAKLPEGSFVAKLADSVAMSSIELQRVTVTAILSVACALLGLGLLCSYALELIKSVKNQENHFHALLASGMSVGKLCILVFLEELIKCLVALVLSVIIAIAAVLILTKVVAASTGLPIAADFSVLLIVFAVNFAISILLTVLSALLTHIVFRNKGIA